MTKKERQNHIDAFDKTLKAFVAQLKQYVSTDSGEWTVKGFIDVYKNVYTISSDTKIVSKILEIHLFPEILKFAQDNGYKVVLAEKQNWYPDLTFVQADDPDVMFAVDLKTTFRRDHKTAGFTLGSHGAYFKDRDGEKNIQFPYSKYSAHFCLGVIYNRVTEGGLEEAEVVHVKDLDDDDQVPRPKLGRRVTEVSALTSITSVIKDFEFFAVQKWKIAGDGQGSGNTANIGSVVDVDDLKNGKGVFSQLGEEWFDEYWINYGHVSILRGKKRVPITNIWDFLEFKGRKDLFDKVGNGAKRRKS